MKRSEEVVVLISDRLWIALAALIPIWVGHAIAERHLYDLSPAWDLVVLLAFEVPVLAVLIVFVRAWFRAGKETVEEDQPGD